uniref:Uncharacterized protein n=1 Tax=Cyprinus carpio TaxID=7962 RepID=A0A8C2JLY5_CYPCA
MGGLNWICSEMHFQLTEANSCLTILPPDVLKERCAVGCQCVWAAGLCTSVRFPLGSKHHAHFERVTCQSYSIT